MLPYIEWTTISLGPLTLQVWGMWVAIGITFAMYLLYKRSGRVQLSGELLLDIALYFLIFGFIGARLGHVLFYEPAYFIANPWEIIAVWHGGMSSFGGFLGAAVGFFVVLKKKRIDREKWMQIMDQLSFVGLYGWLFARVGCFFIHDHLGMPCQGIGCTAALNTPDGLRRYDLALLEIIALLPLTVVFILFRKKKLPIGWFTSAIMVYYGVARFFLDFLREDTVYGGLTPAQYGSLVMVAAGIMFWRRNIKKS